MNFLLLIESPWFFLTRFPPFSLCALPKILLNAFPKYCRFFLIQDGCVPMRLLDGFVMPGATQSVDPAADL